MANSGINDSAGVTPLEDVFNLQAADVGVVSICNNSEGTNLNVLTKEKKHRDIQCGVGDTISVNIHTVDSFSILHLPASKKVASIPSCFAVSINECVTNVPFVNGEGTASLIVVTMHNGRTTINVGSIETIPNEVSIDYINEDLQPGDEVCVRIE